MTSPTFHVIQIHHFPIKWSQKPIKTHWNPLNSMVTSNEIPLEHTTCPKKKTTDPTICEVRTCPADDASLLHLGKKYGEVRDTNGSAVEVNDIYK